MRLPKCRVRTLMVAVVVAALVLAVYAWMERRGSRFQRLARHHWDMAATHSVVGTHANQMILRPSPSLRDRQIAHHHVILAHKYDHAAHHPWLPIAPDPPPPE